MRVCLVRHGETDWNIARRMQGRENLGLNQNGILQSELTGNYFSGTRWDAFISSPLRRAQDTARIIGQKLKHPELQIVDGWIERDFGAASGLTIQQKDLAFGDGPVPGLESESDFHSRIMGQLKDTSASYPEGNVLVITHGAVINGILKRLRDPSSGIIKVGNCSVNLLEYSEGRWHLLKVNYQEHLSIKNAEV